MAFHEPRPGQNKIYKLKINIIFFTALLFMAVLLYRLFQIQIIEYEKYSRLAINNKEQYIPLASFRGEIFTRDETNRIALNRSSFAISLVPVNFPPRGSEREDLLRSISSNFSIPAETVLDMLKKGRWNPYEPAVLAVDVPFEKINFLAENIEKFPGLIFDNQPIRVYSQGDVYGHITGYTGQISQRELDKFALKGYRKNTCIGKTAVEGFYDQDLRGQHGYKIQIVDARGRVKNEIFPDDSVSVPGNNLVLTIDSAIQKNVYEIMQGFTGACIVSRPATGEILALYSYPSYDPNMFIGTVNAELFRRMNEDPRKPFLNRAVQAAYPPSSVFKIIVALAALEEAAISPYAWYYNCEGGYHLGAQFFKCEGYHGNMNLVTALAYSCNVYFYLLGTRIGSEPIFKYARLFGFGRQTGVELIGERSGFVPSHRWKNETFGSYWWDGDTFNLSIGQGYMLVTPLQINCLINGVVNNGVVYKPVLVKKIIDAQTGKVIHEHSRRELSTVPINEKNIKILKKALRDVVVYGTAKNGCYSPALQIAGKTGSAENTDGLPHGWFTCYAPYNYSDPHDVISVTVFVEHGKSGGGSAAPLAGSIMRAIFLKEDPRYSYKRIMQRWATKAEDYKRWLEKRQEKPLESEEHFED